ERLRLVAAELVLGLIFLHQSGIVHQDIKPANIMISSDGHIVIADFGSRVQKTFHPIVLNAHDFITFTPLYAAPELVCRNRAGLIIYDSRVDWWSLGVVLYELATGSAPFTNSSATTTKDEVLPLGDGRHHKEAKRRNMGDFSLSFGAMENLLAALQCDKDDHIHDLVLQLQTFIQAVGASCVLG
ncbi:kinase-like domain-containing protein, partial [Lentinula edodes]